LPVKPVSVLEFIKGLNLFDENDKAAMLRAWKRVTDDSKYRVARADDFRIPERFKKESYWSDVEHALERPYMSGEMNGNYNDNLALLAVDQTRTDAERFSIILFIGRASKAYEVHWLYRDKDLSRYTINRHSGDIYLQEFREDGTSSACDIEWDSGLKNYTCK
jgi:hypothetical protein